MTAPTNQPTASYPFDSRPLTDPVDRAALAAYVRTARASGTGTSASTVFTIVLACVVAVFGLAIGGAVFSALLSNSLGVGSAFVVPLLFLIVAAAIVFAIVFWTRSRRIRQFRLWGFASANGMSYLPELANPQLPGMIFSLGSGRKSADLLRGTTPRFVEFANYQYTTGSGKDSETHPWGYIAIKLDVPLPNIVLDSLANNGFLGSNLPARYAKHQRLSLEGDFDNSFALYCPSGYERDALYLFTPDIMARFMDHAASFDVEIVDDWLFLYAQRQQISTLDPAQWARMFGTVGAVIDKLAQWARWRDERLAAAGGTVAGAPGVAGAPPAPFAFAGGVAAPTPGASGQPWSPPPGVAAPGRRLKRTVPWVTFLVIGGFIVVWFAMQILRLH